MYLNRNFLYTKISLTYTIGCIKKGKKPLYIGLLYNSVPLFFTFYIRIKIKNIYVYIRIYREESKVRLKPYISAQATLT